MFRIAKRSVITLIQAGLLAGFSCPVPLIAQSVQEKVSEEDRGKIRVSQGDLEFVVISSDFKCACTLDEDLLGFSKEKKANRKIENISLKIAGKSVEIPRSSYFGVFNPISASVSAAKKGVRSIIIEGGEAGAGYSLEFQLKGLHLAKVIARYSEAPEDPLFVIDFPIPRHPLQ